MQPEAGDGDADAPAAPSLADHLRAGVAVYNAGRYHAAHDAWEDRWLDLERDTDDESLLHGLIQFTAAVHHARNRNWAGATGLAESAGEYLSGLPADYRGVNVGPVREYLARLAADPELIERARPLPLRHEGRALEPDDLAFPAASVAAAVVAEAEGADGGGGRGTDGGEGRGAPDNGGAGGAGAGQAGPDDPEAVVERAVAYGFDDLAAGRTDSAFVSLVCAYASGENRDLVARRLRQAVARRDSEARDVEDLFDPDG